MPIYEYICGACGELFSKLRKMREADAPVSCPKCGSNEAKRQISACAIGGVGGTSGGFGGGGGG